MIKILDKFRLWIKKFNKTLKELDTYDRVYYNGKLSNLLIILLSFLAIGCFILGFIIFKLEG